MPHQLYYGQTVSYIGVLALIHSWTLGLRLEPQYHHCMHHFVWIAGWAIRHAQDPTRWGDLLLISLLYFPYPSNVPIWTALRHVILLLAGLGTITLFTIVVLALRRASPSFKTQIWPEHDSKYPLVHRCRTTHTRRFPKIHGFSYRYLQISIPVGFRGNCGSLVSVDTPSKRSWLHVNADGYLQRDSPLTTLKTKLSAYLQSQVGSSW